MFWKRSERADKDSSDWFDLAEYNALRAEILQRMLLQHQLIAVTFLLAGTFFTLGLQPQIPVPTLLIYPILTYYLALGYAQHSARHHQLGNYIREHLESPTKQARWESFWRNSGSGVVNKTAGVSPRGIFVGSQVTIVALALYLAVVPRLSIIRTKPLNELSHWKVWLFAVLLAVDTCCILRTRRAVKAPTLTTTEKTCSAQ